MSTSDIVQQPTVETARNPRPGAPEVRIDRPLLVLSELYPPFIGGSALLLDEVYSRLSPDRVSVLTGLPSGIPGDGRGPLVRHVRQAPLQARYCGVLNPVGLVGHLAATRQLAVEYRRAPGVVHCGRVLPEGLWAWMLNRFRRAPYICWSHGEDVSAAATSRELKLLMRTVYGSAAGVMANSVNTRQLLVELGVDASRIHVIYPGVDTDRFHPAIDGSAVRRAYGLEGKLVLLTVGRLQRRKGHDQVLEAMAMLPALDPALHYLIVGAGEERDRLEQLIVSLGLAHAVTFAGAVPASSLPGFYAASDVFVMPNRIEGRDLEGFGMVFLEAAASGKPTIGGASGGVPEAIDDGVTGTLVDGRDARALAAAILQFATEPARRAGYGQAGRQRVERQFTWIAAAQAVARVHQHAAAGA